MRSKIRIFRVVGTCVPVNGLGYQVVYYIPAVFALLRWGLLCWNHVIQLRSIGPRHLQPSQPYRIEQGFLSLLTVSISWSSLPYEASPSPDGNISLYSNNLCANHSVLLNARIVVRVYLHAVNYRSIGRSAAIKHDTLNGESSYSG